MKITYYGIIVAISTIISMSLYPKLFTPKLLMIFAAGFFIQSQMCSDCDRKYKYASLLVVMPLLFALFFECTELKEIILTYSLAAAIGRIACLLTGCCTGKLLTQDSKTPFGLYYPNKIHEGKPLLVHPTVILEIIIQFAIAFIVWKSPHGLIWYGVLNALLLHFTNQWRLRGGRMGNRSMMPVISLLIFSLVSWRNCPSVESTEFEGKVNSAIIVFGIVMGLFASNDININTLMKR